MSFILCMLILSAWCNAFSFPLDQHPQNPEGDGVKKDAGLADHPVRVPLAKDEKTHPEVKPDESPKEGTPQKSPDTNAKKQAADSAHAANVPTLSPKTETNDDFKSHKKFNHANVTEMDSSTLKRLVLVLVALSILFILYLAFRTYRRGKRRGPIIVSKYGVRTRRSDLEMRPLPLDDDDEDETVFDLGNVNSH